MNSPAAAAGPHGKGAGGQGTNAPRPQNGPQGASSPQFRQVIANARRRGCGRSHRDQLTKKTAEAGLIRGPRSGGHGPTHQKDAPRDASRAQTYRGPRSRRFRFCDGASEKKKPRQCRAGSFSSKSALHFEIFRRGFSCARSFARLLNQKAVELLPRFDRVAYPMRLQTATRPSLRRVFRIAVLRRDGFL
jgi:hypothetical protein